MIYVRKSEERGYANHGWLRSYHSFSFANYYDPEFMGWGNLRVINDDHVEAGSGFGEHSHSNMEIITYVLSGRLAHKDSMGNVETINPGEVQRMSAGTLVVHSEFNHSKDATTHLLQIWIEPNVKNIEPSYEQKTIPPISKEGKLALIASSNPKDYSVLIHADASLYAGFFDKDQSAGLELNPNRKAYVHLIGGALEVNGINLESGDALMFEDESHVSIKNGRSAEVLVFDLAA
jgi:redox-sensitive bicupin YhaK (pirin superfamily)